MAAAGSPHAAGALRTLHDARAPSLRARAAQDGCLLLRRCLPAAPLRQLRRIVQACARQQGLLSARGDWCGGPARGLHELPRWIQLQAQVGQLPAYQRLIHDAVLLGIFGHLFGKAVHAEQGSVCRLAPPEHHVPATPAHRDTDYMPDRAAVWIAWIPLADCSVEQGVLAVVPGSHRDPAAGAWAASPMRLGDVLLLSARTLHRACPNRCARRVRISVDLRFMPVASGSEPEVTA